MRGLVVKTCSCRPEGCVFKHRHCHDSILVPLSTVWHGPVEIKIYQPGIWTLEGDGFQSWCYLMYADGRKLHNESAHLTKLPLNCCPYTWVLSYTAILFDSTLCIEEKNVKC